jgi:hypothetical protein
MAEYTKIETARAIICDFCNQLYSDEPCEPADCDWLRMLEEDAADVAPVVHCKDCTHRTEMGNCGHPRHHGILPTAYPYDFCSYGARKDGDDDAKEN